MVLEERLFAVRRHGKNATKFSANLKRPKPANGRASRAAGQELQQTGAQGSPKKSEREVKLEQQLKDAKAQVKAAGQKGKGDKDKGRGKGDKGKCRQNITQPWCGRGASAQQLCSGFTPSVKKEKR